MNFYTLKYKDILIFRLFAIDDDSPSIHLVEILQKNNLQNLNVHMYHDDNDDFSWYMITDKPITDEFFLEIFDTAINDSQIYFW